MITNVLTRFFMKHSVDSAWNLDHSSDSKWSLCAAEKLFDFLQPRPQEIVILPQLIHCIFVVVDS